MLVSKPILFAFVGLAAAGLPRRRQAPSSPFSLFAYNEDIGGLPVASNGADVFIGEVNNSTTAVVSFTAGNNGVWNAAPLSTTADDSPMWSNLSLSIPIPSAGPGAVQLQNASDTVTGRSNTEFTFYGTVAFHTAADGSFESSWLVRSLGDGIWALKWNETGDADKWVPVTLKSTPPSRGQSLEEVS